MVRRLSRLRLRCRSSIRLRRKGPQGGPKSSRQNRFHDEDRAVSCATMGSTVTPSARKTPRPTPCSSGGASRRSTIRPGISSSAGRPIRPPRSSSARKGGKTAFRLQATSELGAYNQQPPDGRVFVFSYDDFNPYLDRFTCAVRAKDPAQALTPLAAPGPHGRHPRAGSPRLVDGLTANRVDLWPSSLDPRRDLLLLAALYDQSTAEPIERRWRRLLRRSGFRPLWSRRDLQIGFGTTLLVVALVFLIPAITEFIRTALAAAADLAGVGLLGLAARPCGVVRTRHSQGPSRAEPRPCRPAVGSCSGSSPANLAGAPHASRGVRTGGEERYELLRKFQGVLQPLGYSRVIVLVDQVDEPQQVEGDPPQMRALVWPLLDPQIPAASRSRAQGYSCRSVLAYCLEKEDKEFYDRAPARQAQPGQAAAAGPAPRSTTCAGDRLRALRASGSATRSLDQRRKAPAPPARR